MFDCHQYNFKTMNSFYEVHGPRSTPSGEWLHSHVSCWWCLKPRSVTEENRCYIPVRTQDQIDGQFATVQEVEDSLTRKWGYFHSWPCALAHCQVHFPHIAFKVHQHAHRHGFQGILVPAADPRLVQSKFNPWVKKSLANVVPKPFEGVYLRSVPVHEQCTTKFRDADVVLESMHMDDASAEFPQCVVESEQLMDQLESISQNSSSSRSSKTLKLPHKNKSTAFTASTASTKSTKTSTKSKRVKKTPKKTSKSPNSSAQPNVTDFFKI